MAVTLPGGEERSAGGEGRSCGCHIDASTRAPHLLCAGAAHLLCVVPLPPASAATEDIVRFYGEMASSHRVHPDVYATGMSLEAAKARMAVGARAGRERTNSRRMEKAAKRRRPCRCFPHCRRPLARRLHAAPPLQLAPTSRPPCSYFPRR
uniref:Uncharacterized protein n=1 Tax=Oryza sativa subsp. japonica TaxID=39947 RepID=Q69XQ1_ORYSJ|nr:hypothetical protein [Oryza sativa Japonica Group]